jgi:phosphoglycerate dehydrogenase-like enzyme
MYKIWFERASPPLHLPLLQGIADVIGPAGLTPDQPFVAIPEAHGIVASIMRYDAHVMDLAPHLLVISRTGIGYDKVDIAAATSS